jgi:hypothetical protein
VKAFAEWIPTSLYGQRRIVNEQLYSNQTLGFLKSCPGPVLAGDHGGRTVYRPDGEEGWLRHRHGSGGHQRLGCRRRLCGPLENPPLASTVYQQGKALLRKAGTALTRLLLVFAFGGT